MGDKEESLRVEEEPAVVPETDKTAMYNDSIFERKNE
jgi:hypothetical protein